MVVATKTEELTWPPNGYPEGPVARAPNEIGVGSVAFTFDLNRRVYPTRGSSCSYLHHFTPVLVTGETRMSWLTTYGKHPKDPARARTEYGSTNRLFALGEVENQVWVNEHRHKVIDLVRAADAATLRRIAQLVGYSA